MALTNTEKQALLELKAQGKTFEQAMSFIGGQRLNAPSAVAQEYSSNTPDTTQPTATTAFQRLAEVGANAASDIKSSIIGTGVNADKSAPRRGAEAIATASSIPLQGAVALTPKPLRDTISKVGNAIGTGFNKLTSFIGSNPQLQKFTQEHPDVTKAIEEIAGTLAAGGEIAGNIVAAKGGVEGLTKSTEMIKSVTKKIGDISVSEIKVGDPRSLFKREPKSIDDVIQQASPSVNSTANASSQSSAVAQLINNNNVKVNVNIPETKVDVQSINQRLDKLIEQGDIAGARTLAEQTAPKLTIQEKWAGIRPDIKQRIAGKEKLMREYFDIAHARNANDTVPTVYEYGGAYALEAVKKMDNLLNETGGQIGKTRTKIGTYQASPDALAGIENTFNNQLERLNLKEVNGVITQKPGTIARVGSKGDISALNDLYQEFKKVKENPSLTNLIDYRSLMDNKINFSKSARDVSSSVDPLARQVRKSIADTSANIVGKSQAEELTKYSNFMDALNNLRSYTDRRAGSEYLLRFMLSGRGGEARQVAQTIKEYTGIDLLDHATMMQISTELVGNEAQKNLFRQEVTKAGLDTASILKGDISGAAATLFTKAVDKILDPEKIFLEASKKQ